jgi:hypothetical protein
VTAAVNVVLIFGGPFVALGAVVLIARRAGLRGDGAAVARAGQAAVQAAERDASHRAGEREATR